MILSHVTAYATEPTCTGIDWKDDRPYRQYVCYPCRVTHRVQDRGTQCDTSVAPAQTFSHFPEGKALNHIKARAQPRGALSGKVPTRLISKMGKYFHSTFGQNM